MNKDNRIPQRFPSGPWDLVLIKDMVSRQQASTRNMKLRVHRARGDSRDQFDSRPDSSAVLPAATRPTKPLPQNRPRQYKAFFAFTESPAQGSGLAG